MYVEEEKCKNDTKIKYDYIKSSERVSRIKEFDRSANNVSIVSVKRLDERKKDNIDRDKKSKEENISDALSDKYRQSNKHIDAETKYIETYVNNNEINDRNENDKNDKKSKNFQWVRLLIVIVVFFMLGVCTKLFLTVSELSKQIVVLKNEVDFIQTELESENQKNEVITIEDEEIAKINNESVKQIEKQESINVSAGLKHQDKQTEIKKKVYLTFDDGPSSNTDRILDILDEYNTKATFFVVGKSNYEEQYKRIVNEGHTLGMHSYTHIYSEIYSSLEAYKDDLQKLKDFLYKITGVECKVVRFPGGSSNSISKVNMRELIGYLDEVGLEYYDWNISSGDANSSYINASKIADNVLKNINKYDNVVILFHDAAEKDSTVDALPIIIEKILESEDTVLLPITEETIPIQHIQ